MRRAALPAGLAGLVALGVSLAAYAPLPASLAVLASVACLTAAARRPLPAFLVLAVLGAAVLGAAFGTVPGYFWLNRHRLGALVAEIASVPGLDSLQMGDEDPRRGTGRADGASGNFDSYRFVNGVAVTHFPRQVAPDAPQPVHLVDDALRRIGVPAARYWALRERLVRLSLGGFAREPDGGIGLLERRIGGTPWTDGFVFSPSGRRPDGNGAWDHGKLAPHWFRVRWD